MKSLETATILGKRVLLRLETNVPLDTSGAVPKIIDDARLRSVVPTIHFLLNRKAKLVLCGHLGEPGGSVQRDLSLRPIYLRLSALLKQPITFAPTLFSKGAQELVEKLGEGEIVGLENLRFDPGEQRNSRTFARKLALYGEIYVDESFGTAHRLAASNSAVTEFLPSYPGLEFEREVKVLGELLKSPERPFVGIVGGAKIADKLPAIRALAAHADKVIVGGGVANTFLASSGVDVGDSLVDGAYLEQAKRISKRYAQKLLLPTDFVKDGSKIIDLGHGSIEQALRQLKGAKTIFWNGPMGREKDGERSLASEAIAHFLAESGATTIVAGGDTVAVLSRLGLTNQVTFASIGGGATLEFVGGAKLPGVEALR